MPVLIEASPPADWRELEANVARILRECGYDVEVEKNVPLARGDVNVDVWADDQASPPNVLAIECKLWTTSVPKNVVHAFRTVVGDSGANTGLIISAAGFQGGAIEAAAYSNVRLLDWVAFQEMFVERWYRQYMAPLLYAEASPLSDYTEPINSRIARKESALPKERQLRAGQLVRQHQALGIGLAPLYAGVIWDGFGMSLPELPLRESIKQEVVGQLPSEAIDAHALRPMLEALVRAFRAAIAEFDEVFGERA